MHGDVTDIKFINPFVLRVFLDGLSIVFRGHLQRPFLQHFELLFYVRLAADHVCHALLHLL